LKKKNCCASFEPFLGGIQKAKERNSDTIMAEFRCALQDTFVGDRQELFSGAGALAREVP
jgi:hypothetical protein